MLLRKNIYVYNALNVYKGENNNKIVQFVNAL